MVARWGGVLKGLTATTSATASVSGGGAVLTPNFLDTDFASAGGGQGNTAYTFSGLSFGTAAANRVLIVVLLEGKSDSPTNGVATGVTIGGVAATKVVGNSSGEVNGSIWQAPVPSGTSGSVVVTCFDNRNTVAVILYSVKTNTQAATNSGSSTTGAAIAATVPTGGYAVVGYIMDHESDTTGGSIAPTNYTEDYDTVQTGGHNILDAGHFTTSASIDSTPSLSVVNGQVMVYASWGP